MFRRPIVYVGGLIVVAVGGLTLLTGSGGCADNTVQLGQRVSLLHDAFIAVYNRDSNVIEACPSVDCEQASKLEIAGSLRTYNDGLNKICWPNSDQRLVNALLQANSAMANAYQAWSEATSPIDDHIFEQAAQTAQRGQSSAEQALANGLHLGL